MMLKEANQLFKNKQYSEAENLYVKFISNFPKFIDSDNSIYKNLLQSYHLAIMLNRNTKVFYAKFKRRYSKKIIGEKIFSHSKLLKGNFIDLGVFVHHKTITDEIGLFDSNLKRLVDYDFIIRATNKFLPVFIDKILLDYNDDNNIKNRISIKESYDDAIEIIRKKYNL